MTIQSLEYNFECALFIAYPHYINICLLIGNILAPFYAMQCNAMSFEIVD